MAAAPAESEAITTALSGGATTPVIDNRVAPYLLRGYDDAAIRFFALALGAQVGVLGQGGMYHAALVGLHRLEADPLLVAFGPIGDPKRQLADRILPAGAVALHVDDNGAGVGEGLADHGVNQELHRPQCLTPPTDEQAEVVAADVDDRRALPGGVQAVLDGGLDVHLPEQ